MNVLYLLLYFCMTAMLLLVSAERGGNQQWVVFAFDVVLVFGLNRAAAVELRKATGDADARLAAAAEALDNYRNVVGDYRQALAEQSDVMAKLNAENRELNALLMRDGEGWKHGTESDT